MMSLQSGPLISVIVPVYNVEFYLRQCLDSIVNQTYGNLEIILVDDGSTDTSGKICDDYAAADRRVRVLHKENGGQISARKAAISIASGAYVAYVDADDWIDLNTYEQVLDELQGKWPDVAVFSYVEEYQTGSDVYHSTFPSGYYDKARIDREIYPNIFRNPLFSRQGIPPYLVVKLVKLELLQKSQLSVYPNVTFCEDDICTVHTLLLMRSMVIIDKPFYHYRKRAASSVSDDFSFQQCKAVFENLNEIFAANSKESYFCSQLRSYILYILLMKQYDLFLKEDFCHIPFGDLKESSAALYGAGIFGREIYRKMRACAPGRIKLWVDRRFSEYRARNLPVEPVEALLEAEYDVILVAVMNRADCETIRRDLTAMGISPDRLRFATLSQEDLSAADKMLMEG